MYLLALNVRTGGTIRMEPIRIFAVGVVTGVNDLSEDVVYFWSINSNLTLNSF